MNSPGYDLALRLKSPVVQSATSHQDNSPDRNTCTVAHLSAWNFYDTRFVAKVPLLMEHHIGQWVDRIEDLTGWSYAAYPDDYLEFQEGIPERPRPSLSSGMLKPLATRWKQNDYYMNTSWGT